jgi:hypothetical protein
MGAAERIAYIKKGLYFRYMRSGSATMSYQPDLFENNLRSFHLAKTIIDRYWTDAYLPVYARTFVIQGALMSIYQICSKQFQGDRNEEMQTIFSHPILNEAFLLSPPMGGREKMLSKKQFTLMKLVGHIWNLKNR